MDELKAFMQSLKEQRPADWEQMPDFPLYMDQVLNYMARQVISYDPEEALTASMVNNYTKSGLLPRAEGKKYNRTHLAYLTAICVLKHVMSTRDMDLLFRLELGGEHTPRNRYDAFLDGLDRALSLIAEEMENYGTEERLEDAAVHFALLSYAAGVASSRCTAALRRQTEEPGKKEKQKKERKDHA